MWQSLRSRLPRLLLTLLLASGLSFALLGALDLSASPVSVLLCCLLLSLGLEALSLNRRAALWGALGLAVLLLFLLVSGPAFAWLSDLLRAFSLRISGIPGALPLMEQDAALVLAGFLTLLSFLSTRKSAGALGALLLACGSMMMLWLADRYDLMPRLLPACVAALSLLLLERHQEASPLRIFPWSFLLVLLAFLLTPASGLVIPELKERADALRQTVMDRLFFTEPRDVFSLANEGYYPQGVNQLGGAVHPSDHPVMQVSAPRSVYLRGAILNEYDGRSWRNTLGGRRYLWDAAGMAGRRSALFDQTLPASALTSSLTASSDISVRMLSPGVSTLFVPQRIRQLRAGGELVPYFTNSSEVFVTRNLREGDTWSVSAPLFMAGDPGLGTLVEAASTQEDAGWEQVLETYTRLPSHLEEPVWQLAAEIAAGGATPYEKAFALQNYLSRSYRYAQDVADQPASLDFVTNFLFNTREGYCTYFASAMTVLCRMAGLPARYVEGYLAEPGPTGEALVTGLNAHAWTEVYFRGFGWLTFDATPRRSGSGFGEGGASPDSPPPSPESSSEPPEETPPEEEPSGEEPTSTPAAPEADPALPETEDAVPEGPEADSPDAPARGGFPWWLLLLLLPAALGARWIISSPLRREKRMADEMSRFDLWLGQVLQLLSAAGWVRRPGETLMAFTRRMDAVGAFPVRLSQLGECASLLHYGRVRPLETDTALAREAALELKKALPPKARAKYALRRLRFGKRRENLLFT